MSGRAYGFCYLFRALFEHSPDAIFLGHLEGKFIACNRAAYKTLGYTKGELLGKSVREIIFKEDARSVFPKIVKDLLKKGSVTSEGRIVRKDKTVFPVEAYFRLVYQEGKPMVFAIVRDISHHKEIEEQISAEREKAENYLKMVGAMIVVLDKQGRIILINQKGNEILGYNNGELLGKDWFTTCLPAENREEVKKIFGDCIHGKLKFVEYYENSIVAKNGEKKFLSWHNSILKDKGGKIIGILSSGEDITEREKTEEELSRVRTLYTSIVESSNDGVVILCENRVKFFNKQMFDMVGYTEVEAYNKPFINFIDDKYKKMVLERYKARLAGKKVNPRYEIELLRKNDKSFPVEINASLISFEGKPAVLSIIRDITQAKEIDKMKTEFVSVASHQLRTPLTGIKWFCELLLGEKAGVLSDKQKDYIEQIATGNARMVALVDDLLDVSHIEAGEKYNVVLKKEDISAIVTEVVKEQMVLAQNKKIKIEFLNGGLKKVVARADKSKISQVFINLINNAVKYTKFGGKIIIGCEITKEGATYFVKDNGAGIPARQLNRLFDRFFRGENVMSTEGGTGLGLYIAKYIVDKHKGRIWCETKENKGSTFYVFLPTA
ncbi:MAG: PAS domain S-box protein [Patescibacteria group bacterium]|nr:PAS domain S-box protein [Patescibacteria group bacterium]